MSNELSVQVSLSFSKGGTKVQRAVSGRFDVAGDAFTHEIQTVAGGNVALAAATAIGTQGYVFVQNLDDALWVDIGITGSPSIRLEAGQFALFPAKAAIFAIAEASLNVEYIIIEI